MSELKAFLKGLLEDAARGLPSVTVRPYFGGHALYAAGQVFALVSREPRLYVRFADAARHAWYLARSASGPGREAVTPPWVLVPEALHDDAEALGPWVREAHAQALAATRARPVKKAPATEAPAGKRPSGGKPPATKAPATKAPARKRPSSGKPPATKAPVKEAPASKPPTGRAPPRGRGRTGARGRRTRA